MVRLRIRFFIILLSIISLCTPQCDENVPLDVITRHIRPLIPSLPESPPPDVSIMEVYYNCRAHSPNLTLFSTLSVTVDFNASYPDSSVIMYTRIDFECQSGAWNAITPPLPISNTSQPTIFRSHSFYKDNCTQCHVSASNPYHCVECDQVCNTSYFGYCTSVGASRCCNFVWQNTCQPSCPDRTKPEMNHSCVCSEFYSGENCEICTYPCANNGTANPKCNACICPQGYTDRNCSTEIDFCVSSPCPRNAVCHSSPAGPTCECIQGYTGVDCETEINYCVNQPCKNDSVCMSSRTGFYCICHAGTMGFDCSVTIDSCSIQNPCSNNGTCINGIRGAECRCSREYTGQFCDNEIDFCITNTPCLNNGNCTRILGNYTCACGFPYSGYDCENTINYCEPNPCSNNSVQCLNTIRGADCVCSAGFSGELCEVNIDDCISVDCNAGACVDSVLNYTCECDRGFIGRHCELNDVDLLCNRVRCENNGSCSVEYLMNVNRSEVELVANSDDFAYKPGYCNCTNEWGEGNCESCLLSCEENQVPNFACSQCICDGLWSGEDCMECEYFREAGACVENCTIDGYQVSTNGTCFACGLLHCLLCNQSRPQECEECESNYTLNLETGACDETPIDSTTPPIATTQPEVTPPPPPEIPPLDFPGLSLGLPLGLLLLLLLIVAIIVIVFLLCKFKDCGCCACCGKCMCGGCAGGGPKNFWKSGQKKTVNIQIVSGGLEDDEEDVVLRRGNKNKKKKKRKFYKDKVLDKYKHLEDNRFSAVAPTASQMPTQSNEIELNENPQYSPERQPCTNNADYEIIYERQLDTIAMHNFPTSTPLQPPIIKPVAMPPQPVLYAPPQIETSSYEQVDDMYSYRDSFTSESIYVPSSMVQHYENVEEASTDNYQTPDPEYVDTSGWQTNDSSYQNFTQASDSTFGQNSSSRTPL